MFDSSASLEEGVTNPSRRPFRAKLPRRGYLGILSITVRTSEAIMTTRKPKPKPAYPPLIEFPTEQLQLVPVTVEHKSPAHAGQNWQADTDLPSFPHPGRITYH
jgi:hypothetical protein